MKTLIACLSLATASLAFGGGPIDPPWANYWLAPQLPSSLGDAAFAYRLVFDEEFTSPLDVAPGTGWGDTATPHRWYCHTPYGGDFGDAYFSGPQDAADGLSPFSIVNNQLVITAWIDPTINHWRSGLLSTMNWAGMGFSQRFGLFEARMKVPKGMGAWPAFWLDGVPGIFKKGDGGNPDTIEIDVAEFYGGFPTTYHANVHLFNTSNSGGGGATIDTVDLSQDFHVYGVLVLPDKIRFYLDYQEVYSVDTPPEAYEPLYAMVDLGLGGGWPLDGVTNPDKLVVDWIRVYAPPGQ